MGYEVDWDNDEHTIVKIRVTPPLTWDEIETAFAQGAEMIKGLEGVGYLIYDATEISSMPSTSNPIGRTQKLIAMKPHNLELFVFVGGSHLARQIVNIFDKALWLSWIATAATLEEAYQLIAARSQTSSSR